MQTNRVRELWKQGKPAVQGWCSTGNSYITEMMGHAGFDAVVIDWQHGVGVSQESIVACMQALGSSDAVPIVRLPRNSLDMGLSLSNWHNDERHIAAVQRIFAAAQANGIVACHHGAGPGVSAPFVKMGSKLCQIGNEMRMLTTATAEAFKAFRDALS